MATRDLRLRPSRGRENDGWAKGPARPNLKDVVADHIRMQILSGGLRPGMRIDQDGIAEDLDVSKLPVREALIALEAEALIENVPRRGSFVAALTRDDVLDHYHIYGLLSALAAERAAETMTDEALERLAVLVERAETGSSAEEQERLNYEFHHIINVAGSSMRLRSVLRLLSTSIPAQFFEFTTGWSEVAQADHRRILDSLRERNAPRAAEAVSDHLRHSGEYAVQLLEKAGFWDADVDG